MTYSIEVRWSGDEDVGWIRGAVGDVVTYYPKHASDYYIDDARAIAKSWNGRMGVASTHLVMSVLSMPQIVEGMVAL